MATVIDCKDSANEQSKPFLKMGQYGIRCISAEKGVSKKGNPMLVTSWELVTPDTLNVAEVKDDGTPVCDDFGNPRTKTIKVAGLQLMDWIVLGGNADSVERNKTKLKALLKYAKLPLVIDLDNEKQVEALVGKALKAQLKTDGGALKDENTGTDLVDEETGKPITENNYRITRFIGSDVEHTVAAEAVAF